MSIAEMIEADRRLIVLRALAEADSYRLNESLLERVINQVGVGFTGRDQVRSTLTWLEQNGMLALEKMQAGASPEALWVATLSKLGLEVARGRSWPGITRPSPAA